MLYKSKCLLLTVFLTISPILPLWCGHTLHKITDKLHAFLIFTDVNISNASFPKTENLDVEGKNLHKGTGVPAALLITKEILTDLYKLHEPYDKISP